MYKLLLFVCLALCVSVVDATERLADQRNLIFDRLSVEQGLSQPIVTAITQDKRGFIWVGTQEGLNRFDGHNFSSFYHSEGDTAALSHDYIRSLFVDESGELWIGTESGLNVFNFETNTFSQVYLSSTHFPVYAISQNQHGEMWIGGKDGLFKGSKLTGFQQVAPQLIQTPVRAIFQDEDGSIYVGSEGQGLFRLDSSEKVVRLSLGLADLDVRDVLKDGEGYFWVATFNGGVTKFKGEGRSRLHISAGREVNTLASNRIRSLLKDHENNVWLASDNGLHLWENGEFRRYQNDIGNPKSLSDNTVLEIFQDEGGVIWVGTFNGISKWNAKVELFPYFRRPAKLENASESNNVTSFTDTIDGDVWIGTFSGLMRWDASRGELVTHSPGSLGLSDPRVMSLATVGADVWAGTMTRGVRVIRDGKPSLAFENEIGNPKSLSSNAVTNIYVDSTGEVWLTTYGGGVNKYLGKGEFQRFPDEGNANGMFSDLRCLDIVEVESGVYWIATQGGGIVVLDSTTGSTTILSHSPKNPYSIPSNEVLTLLAVDEGVWIGTVNRGLSFYNSRTGVISRYSKRDGLASDAVYGLLEDDQGLIWASGGKGLTALNPKDRTFTLFDVSHGLQGNDFNSGAFAKLRDGSLTFGGSNGFNAFYPSRIKRNTHVPQVHVTEVKVFDKKLNIESFLVAGESLEFNHDDSVVSFSFASLDYTSPQKNLYEYKLEGFDSDWRPIEGDRVVTYTNLDSGNYLFRVQGSNNDGVWNREGASLPFIVRPAPWFSWWAYTIYTLLAVALMYLAFQANTRRLQRAAERQYSAQLQLYIESLEEASDGIMIANSQGQLLYANHTTTEGIGKTPDQVVGESLYEVLFDAESDRKLARESLVNDGRYHGEVRFGGSDEAPVVHEVTIAEVQQASKSELAYVGISRDVTQRKQTEAQLAGYRRNLEALVEERTKALQKEIAENKAIQLHLANSLQEKELLLKEVHHRVKNNMQVISSLLSIQAEGVADDTYSNLLNESQQRIKSMALIHETLYQSKDLLKIDFQEYIETLSTSLTRSFRIPGVSVQIVVNVEDVALDLDTAVPCGLIINELVSNSLKHAFNGIEGAGLISVDFVSTGCSYELRIADNGVGLPESFDPTRNSSMGMEIVSILTSQLEGSLTFRNERGAVFEISFPRIHTNVS